MPAYKLWASWGGTLSRNFVSLPCVFLAQPVGAGAGERHWSTYGFIVDKRLSVDRGRKCMYAHFNVRLLRKVRAVDYHSEHMRGVENEVEISDNGHPINGIIYWLIVLAVSHGLVTVLETLKTVLRIYE